MQLSLPHLAPGDAVLSTLGFPFVPFRLGSWKMRTKRDLATGPGRKTLSERTTSAIPRVPRLLSLRYGIGERVSHQWNWYPMFSCRTRSRQDSLKRVGPWTANPALILWIPAPADAAHLFPCAVRPFLAVIEKKAGGGARSRFRSSLPLLSRCSEDKEWALCHHTAKNGRACRDPVAPRDQRPLAAHNGPHGIWCQRDNMIT